jgi:hypothetical protein
LDLNGLIAEDLRGLGSSRISRRWCRNLYLVSLRPDIGEKGRARLDVVGRSIADVSRFIEALEKSPEFENNRVGGTKGT